MHLLHKELLGQFTYAWNTWQFIILMDREERFEKKREPDRLRIICMARKRLRSYIILYRWLPFIIKVKFYSQHTILI